ncbi:ankyrin repeat domain-containing protein [Vibrio astriarenae]|uniref:ankyrin repeat domain-containing protein n=1 Tax=Vibrio astriarenae TaxID=1481923 RepID=UPI003736182C
MALPTLQQYIIENNFEAFQQALNSGADRNQLDPLMGNSPLHIAAQQSSTKWVEALLRSGAFVNLQTPKHGVTPLMVAVWHRKPDVVSVLLQELDINVEIVSTFGLKAEHLVEFGASKDDEFGMAQAKELGELFTQYRERQTKQLAAMPEFNIVTNTEHADKEMADAINAIEGVMTLNQTAPVNCSGNDEHTAVMVAARDGNVQALKVLMDKGADQTIPDHYMKAIPLHKAAYNGHPEVIRLLANYPGFKETLDAQGPNNGYTPLHDAIWHGHTLAAQALIERGARTDLKGYDGKTPLDLAREYQYSAIADMLENIS